MRIKEILVVVFCLLVTVPLFAQHNLKEKKYIFELDITKSMWGVGEPGSIDIFDQVRSQLIDAIETISDPSAEIVLVTWQDKIINTWHEMATTTGKKNLVEKLNAITVKNVPGQNTNIYNAWIEAKKHIDPAKINIAYLLTDGRHSVSNPPISKLYEEVPNWGTFAADKDAYVFVVELTAQAIDEKLRKQVEATDKVEFIHGIEFYTLFVDNTAPVVNIDENLQFDLKINKENLPSKYDNIKVSLNVNSDLFELVEKEVLLGQATKKVKLRMKKTKEDTKIALDEVSYLPIQLSIDENEYKHIKLVNPLINCKVVNKKERIFLFKEI
ncbi:vWA domain-containing protein [Myroides odoratimimus]|uniref:Uncharacterized protein n=3 Tax=Myroides odoratimimus TaxID=76832 RepID=A0A0S7EJL2_9FLAO|nr:vWA domain-containing protein [Myroides odoratimimus]ALU27945.1 hypothetical protein AS202_18110 [Myroides odoratimimus]EHO10309.1 hypothetical protein HMPREF9712_01414 [Myroides odoratimimus CCUG 10230]MCO7723364.1 VWA domain-containing protein [Myroides odoratimimus]MDM1033660.1 VWA domain-containing protein [Myroides odoratimimus]MDM1038618.1 VWA domain-containing protein [Myroides odoratimimus]